MKLRPKGWFWGLAGVAVLLAVACGGGGAAPAPQKPAEPAKPAQPAPAAPAAEPQAPAAPAPAPRPAAPQPAPPPVAQPKYGGVLILAHREDPPGAWDPHRTGSLSLFQVSDSIYGYGNLVKACRNDIYKICPGLAESWEHSPDFTQWTFKIQDNVLWHDGKPFTVENAKYWVELAAFGAQVGGAKRLPAVNLGVDLNLKKAELLPGNRLRLSLTRPEANYLFLLARPEYGVAHPQHLYQPRIEKGEVNLSPLDVGVIGTGPFKFQSFEKGSRAQVRRFDRYWEKDAAGRQLPYLDGVDYAIIRSPDAMDAAFRTGRVDGGARGPTFNLTKERQAAYIRELGDKVWFSEIGFFNWATHLNTLKPGPLQDVRVRKALSLWVDKRAAIPSVLGGFGFLRTLLDPTNPYTSPDFLTWPGYNEKTREQDRSEAKRLLAEAGYAKGFELFENCWQVARLSCEFIVGQLAPLGITFKIKLVDTGGYQVTAQTLDNDINSAAGWRGGVAIPDMIERDLTRYSINKNASPKHEDPKVVEFFDRLRATQSFEQRVSIFRQLERYIILEQVYHIPLNGEVAVTPFRSYVKGYIPPAGDVNNNYDHAFTWLDK